MYLFHIQLYNYLISKKIQRKFKEESYEYFADFLAECKTLESIDFPKVWTLNYCKNSALNDQQRKSKITARIIQCIAHSTSIKKLRLDNMVISLAKIESDEICDALLELKSIKQLSTKVSI